MMQAGSLRPEDAQPVPDAVLSEAIAWQLRMGSGEADAADEHALRQWLSARAEHARAWRQLGEIDEALRPAAGRATRAAMLSPGQRRRGMPLLAALLASTLLAWGAVERMGAVDTWLADHRTGTGERLAVTLPDHSVVHLDARSAIDVDFNDRERTVVLRAGAIYVETAHGDSAERRPFIVRTPEGSLRALGTRFTVQRLQADDTTRLTVVESAVATRPPSCAAEPTVACARERIVRRGETVQLHDGQISAPTTGPAEPPAWKDGMLVLDNQPLAQAVADIARYRAGHLSVDPRVAHLRVTGTVPLDDTDRALAALTAAVPVELNTFTPWWVRVQPRQTTGDMANKKAGQGKH